MHKENQAKVIIIKFEKNILTIFSILFLELTHYLCNWFSFSLYYQKVIDDYWQKIPCKKYEE